MNASERQEFNDMKRQLQEMTTLMQRVINPDGSVNSQVVIQPKDTSTTTATGVVRMETNLGPINVLVA